MMFITTGEAKEHQSFMNEIKAGWEAMGRQEKVRQIKSEKEWKVTPLTGRSSILHYWFNVAFPQEARSLLTNNDFFLSSFHDSFYWYAKTLDAALKENISVNDGITITEKLKNGSFEGIAGQFFNISMKNLKLKPFNKFYSYTIPFCS